VALVALALVAGLTAPRPAAAGGEDEGTAGEAIGGEEIAGEAAAGAGAGPSFGRDVRPLLARYCFKCHGPDPAARKSGMRLDRREDAVAAARSGRHPIVPGRTEESELLRRIRSPDEAERMPPLSTKTVLGEEEKRTLERWIAAGAVYEEHWAFVPPSRPPPPRVTRPGWARSPLDLFILERLEAEGLAPSPEADRLTLARRAALDLTGLPPSVGEADRFARDPSPGAYEAFVDRLLASPHYGERWARRWLDLARYADTNGYEKDRPRSIWPYRDWVIAALNADMPFDRFTIEQLAGDMLPEAGLEARVATGFHRNTMLNEEGGIDPLEFRFHAMTDRVATTGTTWLGLTLGCAQCHSHKFDPVSQREYYEIMAFLDNADEPDLDLPDPDVAAERERRERRIAELVAGLPGHFPAGEAQAEPGAPAREALERAFDAWLETERQRLVRWNVLRPLSATSNLPLLAIEDDGSVFASGDTSKQDTYRLRLAGPPGRITALRLEALPDARLPGHGPGMAYYEGPKGDFFLGELTLREAGGGEILFARASESHGRLGLGGGKAGAALAIDGDPESGWSTGGRQGEAHEAVFVLAAPLDGPRELELELAFGRHYAASLGRFRISVTDDPRGAEASGLPEGARRLLGLPPEALARSGADGSGRTGRELLLEEFLLQAPELAGARREIDELRKMPAFPTTLVLAERPPENPRRTYTRHRGEFLAPREEVEPGVPAALPPLAQGAPRDRLGFALWLVAPESPLAARVAANRQWHAFFGRGLVETLEDFGYQGSPPSHPALLDWLAVELVEGGWSLKRLHRLIMTSATYRQSSRAPAALLARDPENRFLARGPRVRLEAELVRDAALSASGLLATRIGGPSVFPPQPPGVTTEGAYGALEWKPSPGADRYRRGLYTFSKRTAPFAMLLSFDGPSGETCLARREVSNTPLQALTLLNDTVFVEAARALGSEAASAPGTDEDRLRRLFRRVLTRAPEAEESLLLAEFLARQRERFRAGEADAAAIAGGGEKGSEDGARGAGSLAERAAWTALARALLNLDEAVSKR
jgi:hypothetical protein